MRLSLDRLRLFQRLVVLGAVLVPVAYALIANSGALANPPAWDSAITVSPAALTMVELDFDIWEVARLPSSPDGGPSTHATSIYTIGLALLISWLEPPIAFFVAHLVSIALVGMLAAATYLLARQRASVNVSAMAAIAIAILPVVVQQAADVYLDLPLAVVTATACWTASRRRFWSTAGLALLGIGLKSSGVFLLPLLLFARPEGKPVRRHIMHAAVAGLVAVIPFSVVLATTHRFAATPPSLTDLTLIRSSLALFVLTVDVFVVLSVYGLVIYGRARSRTLDRLSQTSVVLIASFFAVHVATMMLSGTIAILPRYYIAILPAAIAALLPLDREFEAGSRSAYLVGVGFVVVLAVFSVLNLEGDFYLRPDDDFYIIAERSTRAQALLELQVLGTRQLVATGLPILAERQVHFRLEYPGMGYVDVTPEEVISVFIERPGDFPDEFAMLIERRFTNPLVAIEQAAPVLGYDLSYENFSVGPFHSQLVVASK